VNDPTGNDGDSNSDGSSSSVDPSPGDSSSGGAPDTNVEAGGGGAGDPGTDYSGDSVPSSTSSFGGTYNTGDYSSVSADAQSAIDNIAGGSNSGPNNDGDNSGPYVMNPANGKMLNEVEVKDTKPADPNQGDGIKWGLSTDPSSFNLKKIGNAYYTDVIYPDTWRDRTFGGNIYTFRMTFHLMVNIKGRLQEGGDIQTFNKLAAQVALAKIFDETRKLTYQGWLEGDVNPTNIMDRFLGNLN
jgi:hypothetical protein